MSFTRPTVGNCASLGAAWRRDSRARVKSSGRSSCTAGLASRTDIRSGSTGLVTISYLLLGAIGCCIADGQRQKETKPHQPADVCQ
ncbi:Uncharacterised protein [Mycobacteroides abscessus subsp. abscessus]|nr:Uncharacterised protein [Mycobacteroides abscessus subsp. abscessus]